MMPDTVTITALVQFLLYTRPCRGDLLTGRIARPRAYTRLKGHISQNAPSKASSRIHSGTPTTNEIHFVGDRTYYSSSRGPSPVSFIPHTAHDELHAGISGDHGRLEVYHQQHGNGLASLGNRMDSSTTIAEPGYRTCGRGLRKARDGRCAPLATFLGFSSARRSCFGRGSKGRGLGDSCGVTVAG
jgi:hypothetical protein